MGKNNFHRSCLERINLSWFVTTLSSAKTKHFMGILICRHFDAVCFYGAHSFSRGNHASDLKHAQSFCRCVGRIHPTLRMREVVHARSIKFPRVRNNRLPSGRILCEKEIFFLSIVSQVTRKVTKTNLREFCRSHLL